MMKMRKKIAPMLCCYLLLLLGPEKISIEDKHEQENWIQIINKEKDPRSLTKFHPTTHVILRSNFRIKRSGLSTPDG
jgi:hypothetical protein